MIMASSWQKSAAGLLLCLCLLNFAILQLFVSPSALSEVLAGVLAATGREIKLGRQAGELQAAWRPAPDKMRLIYTMLNLTEDEAVRLRPPLTVSQYKMNSPLPCQPFSSGRPLDLLVLVNSAPLNFRLRLRLRRTILNASYFPSFQMRTLFLLGLAPDLQEDLEREHVEHGDILQGQFLDTYHNLSIKGVLGLTWVTHHCPHVRVVLKMDDDVFVDTFKLLHRFWPVMAARRRTVFCNVQPVNTSLVFRHGKWKVEERLFRGLQYFPFHYCSGMAVAVTGDLIPALLGVAVFTPVFWIDDIYLFGMLPWMLGNLTFVNLAVSHGYFSVDTDGAALCLNESGLHCPILAALAAQPVDRFQQLWTRTLQLHGWLPPPSLTLNLA